MIDIDIVVKAGAWPERSKLKRRFASAAKATLAELALPPSNAPAELSVCLTDDAHMARLNAQWRGKPKATNVLSFPASPPAKGAALPTLLGDIVLAEETVRREAELEGKLLDHHISHLAVHGLLHLLGYDHETDVDAEEMEGLERRILARLAIPDPYA